MPRYQLIETGQILGPVDMKNLMPQVAWDWERVPPAAALSKFGLREWTPPPAPVVPPTPNEVLGAVQGAVQDRLDAFAKTRQYDNIMSACTYATSAVPSFAAEGQYAVNARDAHWAKCYEILTAVQIGDRPMPTVDQVLSEMPPLEWPA